MAWTQADIDKLKRGIASGAKVIEFGSGETRRKLENRSLAELWEILAEMEAEVAGASAPQRWAVTQFERD